MPASPPICGDTSKFRGLYPYVETHPTALALHLALHDAESFIAYVVETVRTFWSRAFEAKWQSLMPGYRSSMTSICDDEGRLADVSRLVRRLALKVRVDRDRGVLRALRGGYEIAADEVRELVFMPSAFNREAAWSVGEYGDGKRVYLPYYDAALNTADDLEAASRTPTIEAALVLRALGDTTRYAIALLLARRGYTASERANALSVSRPTITHHLLLLRDAGLVREFDDLGSTRIVLRRDVVEGLSDLLVRSLYGDEPLLSLERSRKS